MREWQVGDICLWLVGNWNRGLHIICGFWTDERGDGTEYAMASEFAEKDPCYQERGYPLPISELQWPTIETVEKAIEEAKESHDEMEAHMRNMMALYEKCKAVVNEFNQRK